MVGLNNYWTRNLVKYCINVGGYCYYYANFSSSLWDDRLSLHWTVQMSMALRHRVQCSCYLWCLEETLRRFKGFLISCLLPPCLIKFWNIFSVSYVPLSFSLFSYPTNVFYVCSLSWLARQLWMKVVSLIFDNEGW